MNITFKSDSSVQEMVNQYANAAISYAYDNYNIKLDYSEKSLQDVDRILESMHQEFLKEHWNEDQIYLRAKGYGSYIGEVYRRNHGAEWGMVTFDGEELPGLESAKSGKTFWPWGKAYNRIEKGNEDNICFYYYMLKESDREN